MEKLGRFSIFSRPKWLKMLAWSLIAAPPAPAACASFTTIYSFGSGHSGPGSKLRSPPSKLTFYRGALFGIVATPDGGEFGQMGSVFRYNPSTGNVASIFTNDELLNTYGGLTTLDGLEFGTYIDGGGGELYRVDPVTKTGTVVHSFSSGTDGTDPSTLVVAGGKLYGTTVNGGTNGDGIVFCFDAATNQETILYNQNDDTAHPHALTVSGNVIYGVSAYGGTYGNGSVFKYDPVTKQETVLYSFELGLRIGGSPGGALTADQDALFGTTTENAYNIYGVIFRTSLATGNTSTVHAFTAPETEGKFPNAELVRRDGYIYGTTWQGGSNDVGTVFRVDLRTKALTVLHTFTGGTDGGYPRAGLTIHNGVLYGTTQSGGAFGGGTIYTVVP